WFGAPRQMPSQDQARQCPPVKAWFASAAGAGADRGRPSASAPNVTAKPSRSKPVPPTTTTLGPAPAGARPKLTIGGPPGPLDHEESGHGPTVVFAPGPRTTGAA